MKRPVYAALWEVLADNLTSAECEWLKESSVLPALELMTAFVAVPRYIARREVNLDARAQLELQETQQGFSVFDWDLIRLSRVWLLGQLDASSRADFVHHLETLFDTAEMNELVALYSALPVLPYPEQWLFRATEAVRSNMGVVFDAIALRNPYPSANFNEQAWNQLVLKAIFNDKPIHLVYGLDERVNEKLARTLSDFAHERWAAGRQVPPQVWRLVVPFMDAGFLQDMEHLFHSDRAQDGEAAALACYHSGYEPAKALADRFTVLQNRIQNGELTWTNLEFLDPTI